METVLIVDDEKVIRNGCKRAFVSEGFRVLTAANGQEALHLFAAEKVDIILCDLKMPVMGALEVLGEIRKHTPDLPLIIITGQGTTANAVECMRAGVCDFITKPFRIEELIAAARRAINGESPPAPYVERERG